MASQIVTERIPDELLRASLLWNLGQEGKNTSQIENEKGIMYGDRRNKGFSWHEKGDIDARIGLDLGLGEEFVESDEFAEFKKRVLFEIRRLEKDGQIEVWRKGNRMAAIRASTSSKIPESKPTSTDDVLLPAEESILASDEDMVSAFNAIMERAPKDTTYKFALARAILAHCHSTDENDAHRCIIQYDYLADEFLKYYWYQECKFKIKQNFHVKSDSNAVQMVREAFDGDTLSDFDQTDLENRNKAKKMILGGVFGNMRSKKSQVVPKFQKFKVGKKSVEQKWFYKYYNSRKFIELKPEAFDFFKKYNVILLGKVLLEWTRFLERTNDNLPHLVAKIEGMRDRKRRKLTNVLKVLYEHDTRCFYCRATLKIKDAEVDHFIPWSYIFEDEMWNLVLSCKPCNHKKSDSLVENDFVEALVCRNRRYSVEIGEMDKSLKQLSYRREWQEEIWEYYENCTKYGFTLIPGMRPVLQ